MNGAEMASRRLLILGYGRLGQAFCRLCHAAYQIRGVKRTPLSSPPAGAPCDVVLLPIQSEALRSHLEWAETVIFCPASGRGEGGRGGENDSARYRETYLGNIEFVIRLMARAGLQPKPFILIGSTGVYPRSQGGVWDEERAIVVESDRQGVLLRTEQALIASGMPYLILRCGGLYGEGRENFAWLRRKQELRSSELTDEPLALVHQDDVCGVIDRVIQRGVMREIFNVRDDSVLSRKALFGALAARANIPIVQDGAPPPQAHRHIPNTKVKTHLGYQFHSPPITTFLT